MKVWVVTTYEHNVDPIDSVVAVARDLYGLKRFWESTYDRKFGPRQSLDAFQDGTYCWTHGNTSYAAKRMEVQH